VVTKKNIVDQNLSSKPAIIQTSKLKKGIYFYRIFDGERIINYGKWVKQ